MTPFQKGCLITLLSAFMLGWQSNSDPSRNLPVVKCYFFNLCPTASNQINEMKSNIVMMLSMHAPFHHILRHRKREGHWLIFFIFSSFSFADSNVRLKCLCNNLLLSAIEACLVKIIVLTLMSLNAHATKICNGAAQFSVSCYNCTAFRASGSLLAISNDATYFIIYSRKDLEAVWAYVCLSHKKFYDICSVIAHPFTTPTFSNELYDSIEQCSHKISFVTHPTPGSFQSSKHKLG